MLDFLQGKGVEQSLIFLGFVIMPWVLLLAGAFSGVGETQNKPRARRFAKSVILYGIPAIFYAASGLWDVFKKSKSPERNLTLASLAFFPIALIIQLISYTPLGKGAFSVGDVFLLAWIGLLTYFSRIGMHTQDPLRICTWQIVEDAAVVLVLIAIADSFTRFLHAHAFLQIFVIVALMAHTGRILYFAGKSCTLAYERISHLAERAAPAGE